ncbi:leucine-rich repeat domain-containing protein [Bacteroides thetaiotaomicron]|uniref:leucine-rich repeat domain-containing protein n=1 Tax=Bacteroides thetaiotaomicron TaxID=818 RepID=UPI002165C204|nr:leucine-rich repeat domain-containing protein [Bacteroides thetaiotaomicron]MCS3196058.1 leucine-rich repeat domain-containing protein [Bacteroides thetaiotaomicron]
MEITNFDEFQYFVNYTNSNGSYLDSANNNRIDSSPFQNCTNLKSIVLPPNIFNIALRFLANTKITEISIPKSVSLCNIATFRNCVNLTNIMFADGGNVPLYIGGDMWLENTLVTTLVLPARIYKIQGYWKRGSNLTTLYLKSITPPLLVNDWGDNPDTCDLYVPIGCKEVYASATNWGSFRTITEYDFDLNPNNVH